MATVCDRTPFTWTRETYMRAAEVGIFGDLRVELIDGEVLTMSPMGSRHSTTVSRVQGELQAIFSQGFYVRTQMAVDLEARSQPEPDVAVVSGSIDDYDDHHPSRAMLIVEVADTSLRYDRKIKSKVYASAGLEDYWIVNLEDEVVEIYRKPDAQLGYKEKLIAGRGEKISPLAAPSAVIEVDRLLPKRK
jgi:Uma2 family endonuclease